MKEKMRKGKQLLKEGIQEDINQSIKRNVRHRVRTRLALIQIPGDLYIVYIGFKWFRYKALVLYWEGHESSVSETIQIKMQ